MPFLLLLLSAVGSILWIMYLWKGMGGKTPHLRLKNKWQKQAEADPISQLKDPRDAAVLLMLGMAECEGAISSGQKQTIIENCKRYFESDDQEAADFYTANSFLLKKTPNLERMVAMLTPLVKSEVGEKERAELLEMMRSVAIADKEAPNQEQLNMLNAVRAALELDK